MSRPTLSARSRPCARWSVFQAILAIGLVVSGSASAAGEVYLSLEQELVVERPLVRPDILIEHPTLPVVYVTGDPGSTIVSPEPRPYLGVVSIQDPKNPTFVQRLDIYEPDQYTYNLATALSPDGKHIYVARRHREGADPWTQRMAVFTTDIASGELTFSHFDDVLPPAGITKGLAISPSGSHVFTTDQDDNVAAYSRDPASGSLTFQDVLSGFAAGSYLADRLLISPDEEFIYVRSPASGGDFLEILQFAPMGPSLSHAGSLALDDYTSSAVMSSDGAFIYVSEEEPSADPFLHVYSRNVTTGTLALLEQEPTVNRLENLTLSRDGLQIYGTKYVGGEAEIFSRDAATGLVAPLQHLVDGEGGADGLQGVQWLLPLGDPATVYTLAREPFDEDLGIFDRDAGDGTIEFFDKVSPGAENLELGNLQSAAVSPDGRFFYGHDKGRRRLLVLDRDPESGTLSYAGRFYEDDDNAVDGLEGDGELAIAPDGKQLFITSDETSEDSPLTVYDVDTATGDLSLNTTIGAPDLPGPPRPSNTLAISASGRQLLVNAGGMLNLFQRDPLTGSIQFRNAYGPDLAPGVGAGFLFHPGSSRVVTLHPFSLSLLTLSEQQGLEWIHTCSGSCSVDGPDLTTLHSFSDDGSTIFVQAYYDDFSPPDEFLSYLLEYKVESTGGGGSETLRFDDVQWIYDSELGISGRAPMSVGDVTYTTWLEEFAGAETTGRLFTSAGDPIVQTGLPAWETTVSNPLKTTIYGLTRNTYGENPEGIRLFQVIETEIFSDGFESGDTSAW